MLILSRETLFLLAGVELATISFLAQPVRKQEMNDESQNG
jgi:hypothetical protein